MVSIGHVEAWLFERATTKDHDIGVDDVTAYLPCNPFCIYNIFFSPGETRNIFGGLEVLVLPSLYFLFFLIVLGFACVSLFRRRVVNALAYFTTLSLILAAPLVILSSRGLGPRVAFAIEHAWDRLYALENKSSCRASCSDNRIVNVKTWGGGIGGGECIDRLFYVSADDEEQAETFVRRNMPDDAPGMGTSPADIQEIGYKYYSAISCSM